MRIACFLLYIMLLFTAGPLLARSENIYPDTNRVNIKGTRVWMVPPHGFSESLTFKGFKQVNSESSMIMINEIPGPYTEIIKGFTENRLATGGMKLKQKESILVGNKESLWVEVEQSGSGKMYSKIILITPQPGSTLLLNGVYPVDSLKVGEEIRQSFHSLFIDTLMKINPRNELDYSLYEQAGNFVFVGVIGNGMLFNRDGLTPTRSGDETMLVTDKSYIKQTISDRRTFSISRLKQYPQKFEWLNENGVAEISLDGLDGTVTFGRSAGSKEDIYQVLLFEDDGGYYLLVGTYPTNRTDALKDIKAVFQTFRRK
jgi:hypothetical protein